MAKSFEGKSVGSLCGKEINRKLCTDVNSNLPMLCNHPIDLLSVPKKLSVYKR